MSNFTSKQKGNIAELAVAADLAKRGHLVAFPFGEYGDFDLLVERVPSCTCRERSGACSDCPPDRVERVQVKYATSDDEGVLIVRARCHSVHAGKVSKTKLYTSADVDWIAVYDGRTERIFYLPASELGTGQEQLRIRLEGAKSYRKSIRWASNYTEI